MKQFEYKIASAFYLSLDELNQIGSEGWELIILQYDCYYIFKREKEFIEHVPNFPRSGGNNINRKNE